EQCKQEIEMYLKSLKDQITIYALRHLQSNIWMQVENRWLSSLFLNKQLKIYDSRCSRYAMDPTQYKTGWRKCRYDDQYEELYLFDYREYYPLQLGLCRHVVNHCRVSFLYDCNIFLQTEELDGLFEKQLERMKCIADSLQQDQLLSCHQLIVLCL